MDINNLTENVLRRMPANLTQIEQARYIYLQLGKLFTFDEKYWLGNSKTRRMIYRSARKIQAPKDLKSNKVICVSLTNTYNSLLRRIGIEAEAVHAEDDLHVYSIFKIDGVEYEADEKFGYTYEGDEYLAILIDRLRDKLELIPNMEQKMKYALQKIEGFMSGTDMGFVEKMLYYEIILPDVFSTKEAKKVQIMDMYVEEDGERKYTCCISANKEKNEYVRYIYSEKTGTFLPIEEKELIKLMENGLRTVGNKKIQGMKKVSKVEEESR